MLRALLWVSGRNPGFRAMFGLDLEMNPESIARAVVPFNRASVGAGRGAPATFHQPKLLHHAERILVTPAFANLAVANAVGVGGRNPIRFAGRRNAHEVAGHRALGDCPRYDTIAVAKRELGRQHTIRERF